MTAKGNRDSEKVLKEYPSEVNITRSLRGRRQQR